MSKPEPMYQLVNQNQFEMVFEPTTLETATDVMYTKDEMVECFFGGSMPDTNNHDGWSRLSYWWSEKDDVVFVNLSAIRSAAVNGLANKTKTKGDYEIDFVSERTSERMADFNEYFKQSNVMFRPSKKHFVHYRQLKKKVQVSGQLLNSLRSQAVWKINQFVAKQAGFTIEFKYCNGKKEQARVLRFAHDRFGMGLEDLILLMPDSFGERTEENELLTVEAFKKWASICLSGDELPDQDKGQQETTVDNDPEE